MSRPATRSNDLVVFDREMGNLMGFVLCDELDLEFPKREFEGENL